MTSPAHPLAVRRRGEIVEILAGNVLLLSSAALETELAFGRLAREPHPAGGQGGGVFRVLIGGLGFGATAAGALEVSPPDATIVVAEKVPQVVDLVRGELAGVLPGGSRPLDDPRVRVEAVDVLEAMRAAASEGTPYDAILLDVDNGPQWASFRTNARLYTPAGLAAARAALAPGGLLAVWSGYPADAFLARLREAGFAPERVLLHERGRVRARAYVGYTGARP